MFGTALAILGTRGSGMKGYGCDCDCEYEKKRKEERKRLSKIKKERLVKIQKYIEKNNPNLPEVTSNNFTNKENLFLKLLMNDIDNGTFIIREILRDNKKLEKEAKEFYEESCGLQKLLLAMKFENAIFTPNDEVVKKVLKSTNETLEASPEGIEGIEKENFNDNMVRANILAITTKHITFGDKLNKNEAEIFINKVILTKMIEIIGVSNKAFSFIDERLKHQRKISI